jgi:hypothetical protein
MALRTARRLVVRGRPPGRAAGRTGRNKSPRRVGQVGVVESSAHRTRPFGPDQRSFKKDGNFSNTLSEDKLQDSVGIKPPKLTD